MRRLLLTLALATLPVALVGAAPAAAEPTPAPPPKCANFSCQDPLFTVDYPANTTFVTSHNVLVHLPVQFYDSNVFLLFGKGDLSFLTKLTAGTGYQPIRTEDGRGVMALDWNDWQDTNLGPYNELIFVVLVSDRPVTIDSNQNPWELVGNAVDSDHKVWIGKLVLDHQLGIDVGREYYHVDKVPTPQLMTSDLTTSRVRFSAADPQGRSIVSGDFPFDTSPAAQTQNLTQLGSTPGMQKWFGEMAVRGGVGAFDYVYRDIFDSSKVVHAHAAGRPATSPSDLSLTKVGSSSSFSVRPVGDFGKLLYQARFDPSVGIVFRSGRWALDNGWAPATEPRLGGGATASSAMDALSAAGTVAP